MKSQMVARRPAIAPVPKKYALILKEFKINPQFHEQFVEFVETGEVVSEDKAFLDLYETNETCQQAVEKAFALRIGNLRDALKTLKDM